MFSIMTSPAQRFEIREVDLVLFLIDQPDLVAYQVVDGRCVATDFASMGCFLEALASKSLPKAHGNTRLLLLLLLFLLVVDVATDERFNLQNQLLLVTLVGTSGTVWHLLVVRFFLVFLLLFFFLFLLFLRILLRYLCGLIFRFCISV